MRARRVVAVVRSASVALSSIAPNALQLPRRSMDLLWTRTWDHPDAPHVEWRASPLPPELFGASASRRRSRNPQELRLPHPPKPIVRTLLGHSEHGRSRDSPSSRE